MSKVRLFRKVESEPEEEPVDHKVPPIDIPDEFFEKNPKSPRSPQRLKFSSERVKSLGSSSKGFKIKSSRSNYQSGVQPVKAQHNIKKSRVMFSSEIDSKTAKDFTAQAQREEGTKSTPYFNTIHNPLAPLGHQIASMVKIDKLIPTMASLDLSNLKNSADNRQKEDSQIGLDSQRTLDQLSLRIAMGLSKPIPPENPKSWRLSNSCLEVVFSHF